MLKLFNFENLFGFSNFENLSNYQNSKNFEFSKLSYIYIFWVFVELKKNVKIKNKFKNRKIE